MFRIFSFLLIFSFLAAAPAFAETTGRKMEEMSIAVLRTIDKISARTSTFEVPVDKTVQFGSSLYIRLRACRKASPLDQPESAAFLQIWEKKPADEKSKWVFSGWMFASNPSLSAMDHPVYDVWVIDCKNNVTSSKPEKFSSEKAPEGEPVGAKEPSKEDPLKPEKSKPKADAPKSTGDEPAEEEKFDDKKSDGDKPVTDFDD